MSDSYEIENNAIDGEDEMGSLNHGTAQTNLAGLLKFKCEKKLAVITELSIDISGFTHKLISTKVLTCNETPKLLMK